MPSFVISRYSMCIIANLTVEPFKAKSDTRGRKVTNQTAIMGWK